MKTIYLIVLCCILSSCTSYPSNRIEPIRKADSMQVSETPFITLPTPSNYSICIEANFYPIATNAGQEREQIKHAVALLEIYSGTQAGTGQDRAKNDMSKGIRGQLDCIDEASNTTVYLRLLADSDLLQFHQQASRTHRGGLFAPHNTATIIDTQSNTRYAVDSWFYANGEQPVIIPLLQWKNGWEPAE